MILVGAGLTMLAFTLYPQAAAVTPWISARYLVGLLIAIPALIFPLWEKKDHIFKFLRSRRSVPTREPGRGQAPPVPYTASGKPIRSRVRAGLAPALARYVLVLVTLVAALMGTIEIFTTQLPMAQASNLSQQTLVNRLVQMDATQIYTDYDDCNRIAFLSNERIICAVLDNGLQPGLDRYYPYRAQVANSPHPFYVFPAGAVQAFLLEQKASEQHISLKKFFIGDYVVYAPAQRVVT
jgi:hypothetical protein